MRVLLFIVLMACSGSALFAQCCSMGNPQTAQSASGLLPKNNLRIHAFYKHGYNETYFRENIRLINYGMFSHSSYDFTGLALSYGITDKITISHEAGYFIQKQLRYHDPYLDQLSKPGFGLSNGTLNLEFAPFSQNKVLSGLSVLAGIKYPFSKEALYIDNVELPVELQPSTGAVGFVGKISYAPPVLFQKVSLFFQHRYETNQPNYNKYTYGPGHNTSVTATYSIHTNLNAGLQLRNEYKSADKTPTAARLASEGSNVIFASASLGVMLPGTFQLQIFGELPLYKYYFGEQLSNKYAFGFSLTRDICL